MPFGIILAMVQGFFGITNLDQVQIEKTGYHIEAENMSDSKAMPD